MKRFTYADRREQGHSPFHAFMLWVPIGPFLATAAFIGLIIGLMI